MFYTKENKIRLNFKRTLRIVLLLSAIKMLAEYFSFNINFNNLIYESSIVNFIFDSLFIIVGTIYAGIYLKNIYKFTISLKNRTYNSSDKKVHKFIKECFNFIRFYLFIIPTILINSISLNLVFINGEFINSIKIADIVIGTLCLVVLVSVFITFIIYKKMLIKEAEKIKELELDSLFKINFALLDKLIEDIKITTTAKLINKEVQILKEESKDYADYIDGVFLVSYSDIAVINKKMAMPALVF